MAEMIITSTVISCFFFKQKTAYEMRISDWSSDVCSSDLEPAQCRTQRRGAARRDRRLRRGVAVEDRVELRIAVGGLAEHIGVGVGRRRGEQAEGRARKSVVSGKSVSVRVDLGGRRIIKKNTHRHTHEQPKENHRPYTTRHIT